MLLTIVIHFLKSLSIVNLMNSDRTWFMHGPVRTRKFKDHKTGIYHTTKVEHTGVEF